MVPDGEVLERSFTSKEGGFKIGLPPAKVAPPEPNETHTTRFKWMILNRGIYEVSYYDTGKDLENGGETSKIFDNVRDTLVAKGGKLQVDKELMLSGHPGREFKFRDDKGIDIQHYYLVGERMYTVAAYIPIKLECALEEAVKVLDSFEFINDKSIASGSHSNPDVYAHDYRQRR